MCHAIHFHRMFVWVPTNFDPCSCTRSHLYILIKHWHFYDDSSQCQRQNIRLLCWAKNRDSIILSKRFICTNIIVGNTPISIFAAWDTVQRRHAVLSIALFLCRATKSRQKLFLDSVQIEINLSALLLFLPSPETVSLVKVFSARGQPQRPPSHLKVHTASYHFLGNGKIRRFGCSLLVSGVALATHHGLLEVLSGLEGSRAEYTICCDQVEADIKSDMNIRCLFTLF